MNKVLERPARKTWKLVCRFKFFGRQKIHEEVIRVSHSRLELAELIKSESLRILASESVPCFERRPVEEVLILSSDIVLVEQ